MTEKEELHRRALQLDLEANGVISAINEWEHSDNGHLRQETIFALGIQARILMARARGIREYLERQDD